MNIIKMMTVSILGSSLLLSGGCSLDKKKVEEIPSNIENLNSKVNQINNDVDTLRSDVQSAKDDATRANQRLDNQVTDFQK